MLLKFFLKFYPYHSLCFVYLNSSCLTAKGSNYYFITFNHKEEPLQKKQHGLVNITHYNFLSHISIQSSYVLLKEGINMFLEWNTDYQFYEFESDKDEVAFDLQRNRNSFVNKPIATINLWVKPQSEGAWEISEVSEYEVESYVFPSSIINDQTCLSYTLNTIVESHVNDITRKQIIQK